MFVCECLAKRMGHLSLSFFLPCCLAVVQLVLQLVVDLHQGVQLGDDLPLQCLLLRLVRGGGGHLDQVALRLDVQLAAVAAEVGVADRRGNGDHAAGAHVVVAEEEDHLLHLVGGHLQVVAEDDVLGGAGGSLRREKVN